MIERFPEGTSEIPYPHKIIRWKDGQVTLTIELDPHMRGNPPKIAGYEPFFVGFHGYDQPMHYSYRPAPPPARPDWRRQVRSDSAVLYALGCCVEDRETLTDEQLDLMWQQLAEDGDLVWNTIAGPAVDAIEDMIGVPA